MSILGWLVSVVYKALFLTGDSGYKLAHPLAKLVIIASVAAFIAQHPVHAPVLIPLVLVLGFIYPGSEWVVAASLLSLLAGAYLAVSAYLLSLLGLYYMSLVDVVLVALRTYAISIAILFLFNTISPVDLYNALYYLKAGSSSNYPLLLWRLIPQGLKNFAEAISLSVVKGEKAVKRIPAAVASVIEAGWFIEEYCYWRLRTKPQSPISSMASPKHTLILLVAALAIALLSRVL